MNDVWVLFGIYYVEDFYEYKSVISVHAEAFTAHEHKEFLERCSNAYDKYEIECFELLKRKTKPTKDKGEKK